VPTRDTARTSTQIVLASSSPRRRDLLRLLGISFSVRAAEVNEEPTPGERPAALTRRLARSKALAVDGVTSVSTQAGALPDISRSGSEFARDESTSQVVLAADTVVVLGDTILGKPGDEAEAVAMLTSLRGRAHRVLTGVAVAVAGEIAWERVVETIVWMRAYGDDELERYVRSGSPLDKAGAYGIQDADFRPVDRIEGCLSNVVGLPICEVHQALLAIDPEREWGFVSEERSETGHFALCDRALG
jgi:MAF protein